VTTLASLIAISYNLQTFAAIVGFAGSKESALYLIKCRQHVIEAIANHVLYM
jgi:hypothetical protein